jgi:glycosyltransferase involved in cell wall biosynthesis
VTRVVTVTHYHRRPLSSSYSIERVYGDVRRSMDAPYHCRVAVSRFPSKGVLRRLYNILEAVPRQSDVNHITGDVHYLALFLRRRRTVLTIHDCVSLERLYGLRRTLLWLLWYKLPVMRAAAITVGSKWAAGELLRHVRCPQTQIHVVPHSVSPCFQPTPRPRGWPPTVLQVGTGANKNLLRLADALGGLVCRLHVVGEMTSEQREALARHRIDYRVSCGLTDQGIRAAYEEADAVAFVSTYEGFGLPIIEAQAVGRPVITSDVGPMPEVAGDAACTVDPLDVGSIRTGIHRVLYDQDYADALVERGFMNVRRYEPHAVARRYADIYGTLLEADGG